MNNEDRKVIAALVEQLENIESEVEHLADDLQDRADNLPESFEERASVLTCQAEQLADATTAISDAIECLERADE